MRWKCALFLLLLLPSLIFAQEITLKERVFDPQGDPQLSGTVVDVSGAAIARATMMVRSANGTVERLTQSESDGSFNISGLPAGDYRLIVSSPGFETK